MPDSNIYSTQQSSTDGCSRKHIVISEDELSELPRSTYECDLCGLQVKTKANLRAHHVKTHRILKSDSDFAFYTKQKNTVSYVYHCPMALCKHNIGGDGGFASCSRLKQHYQNVHMSKAYTCQRCEQRFPTPTAQAYHMRLCGNVYICSVCSKAYSIKKNLTQHFRRSGHHPVSRTHNQERRIPPQDDYPTASECRRISATDILMAQNEVNLSQSQQSVWVPFLMLPIPLTHLSGLDATGIDMYRLPSNNAFTTPLSTGCAVSGPFLSNVKAVNSDATVSKTSFRRPSQLVSEACGTSPLIECGTQTEYVDVAVDATVPGPNAPSVSVNIGTDEDDITAFIGSLFCDASVETELPIIELVNEFTDTELDALGGLERVDPTAVQRNAYVAFDASDLQCVQPTLNYPETQSPTDKFCCETNGFQPFSLSLMSSMENTEIHTDQMGKDNVSVVTKDRQAQLCSNRPLETPPPLRSQNNTHLMSICRHRLLGHSQSKQPTPNLLCRRSLTDLECADDVALLSEDPVSSTVTSSSLPGSPLPTTISAADESVFYPSSPRCYTFSESSYSYTLEQDMKQTVTNALTKPQQEYALPSIQSVGLQSNLWSPTPPMYTSMGTQTRDADLESWLNSVHTQTSISMFDWHTSFSDMGVGVDEDFLTAALESVETEQKLSNV